MKYTKNTQNSSQACDVASLEVDFFHAGKTCFRVLYLGILNCSLAVMKYKKMSTVTKHCKRAVMGNKCIKRQQQIRLLMCTLYTDENAYNTLMACTHR